MVQRDDKDGKETQWKRGLGRVQGISILHVKILSDEEWIPWKFSKVPQDFWEHHQNRLSYFEWLSEQLGYRSDEDVYKLTSSIFRKYHGVGLLSRFNDSIYELVKDVYPNKVWLPWKFHHSPKKFWMEKENQHDYIKWLESQLNISSPDDWYKVTTSDVKRNNGTSLLSLYSHSVYVLLKNVYPEVDWDPWKFKRVPKHIIWSNPDFVREYILKIKDHFNVVDKNDWYRISRLQLIKNKYGRLLMEFGNLGKALKFVYPNEEWNQEEFSLFNKKSTQRWLAVCLKKLFGEGVSIFEDYFLNEVGYELDIYVPSLSLAVEYQGEQHFFNVSRFNTSPAQYQESDLKKAKICEERGVHLLQIPYWWDGTCESLASTIILRFSHLSHQFPSLKVIASTTEPISTSATIKQPRQPSSKITNPK
eukprot:TRINITY_DN7777_c0_g1_i1.p1 TRINITY_DN7777_c0_g1~~TRINITY_DN7777_c0_g1_i1.p1  ORF type:complete len:419 (-),score=47.22 TRINITY_DN7777_c0_g1_i1:95-1351(-)